MKNKKKYSSVPMFTHLRRKHKSLYNRWYQMQKRAGTLKAYRHVRVSPEFKGHQGFVNFYDHMGLPPTPQHQMDRSMCTDTMNPATCVGSHEMKT